MADLNNWSITGRLTANAEFKTLATGKSILTANVAVNTGYGEYKKTTFVKVQQWGDKGKNVVDYLTKGSLIGCCGELTTNEWTTREGEKRIDLQLTTAAIQILSSKKQDSETSSPSSEADAAPTDPVF